MGAGRSLDRGGKRRSAQGARTLAVLLAVASAALSPATASETMEPPARLTRRDNSLLHSLSVFYNLTVWPAGKTIRVCFFPEEPQLRQAMVDAARQWQKIANVYFDFGPLPAYHTCAPALAADIRIRFTSEPMGIAAGSSRIGTTSLLQPPEEPTMRIASRSVHTGAERMREALAETMLHELGHALGLAHEHQHPASVCHEEHLLATICSSRPPAGAEPGRHRDLARKQANLYRSMPRRVDPVPVLQLPYDVNSIMHYRFRARFLKGGEKSACFSSRPRGLSDGDRRRMVLLYPVDAARQATFLREQIEVFRQTLKSLQLSQATARRLAGGLQQLLRLRHGSDVAIGVDDLGLSEDPSVVQEELLAFPLPDPLPEACLAAANRRDSQAASAKK